jgi:hypothetical protein
MCVYVYRDTLLAKIMNHLKNMGKKVFPAKHNTSTITNSHGVTCPMFFGFFFSYKDGRGCLKGFKPCCMNNCHDKPTHLLNMGRSDIPQFVNAITVVNTAKPPRVATKP